MTEPSIVFFHNFPSVLGAAKLIFKLILLWEAHWIHVETFINEHVMILFIIPISILKNQNTHRLIKRTISKLCPLGVLSHWMYLPIIEGLPGLATYNQITEEQSIGFLRIKINYCQIWSLVSVISAEICLRLLLWHLRLTSSTVQAFPLFPWIMYIRFSQSKGRLCSSSNWPHGNK